MDWTWRILFLVASVKSGHGQVQLVQSAAELKRPGASLKISCKVTGSTSIITWMHWLQQGSGQGLEWIGAVDLRDGDLRYSQKFQGRATITGDKSSSTATMELSSLRSEDTAVYYCARSVRNNYPEYWGQGTLVTVSTVPLTSPKIFPLSLPWPESGNPVILGCLIKDFFPPAPVTVTWSKSGKQVDFPPAMAEEGSLYTMSSQLTTNECTKDANVTCSVEHVTSDPIAVDVPCAGTIPTTVPPTPPPCECCTPSLSLQRPSLEDLLLGSDASLTCTLSGLKSSNEATFSWQPSGKVSIQPVERDSCGCYSVSSVLHGCAEPWNRGETFTCTVNHPDLDQRMTATITKATDLFPPQVHLLPPPSEELSLNELVSLTCLVRGFSPKEVLVRWLHKNEEVPKKSYLVWEPLPEPNEGATTYAMTSVLRVTASAWKLGDNYSCMVGHEALPLSFTEKTINYYTGKPTHVNVSVIMSEADGTCY